MIFGDELHDAKPHPRLDHFGAFGSSPLQTNPLAGDVRVSTTSMVLQFDRPKGAPLDVAELEYCSALRQTDTSQPLQPNASLTAEDVRLHILSRHGVVVSIEQVESEILIELAGGQEYSVRKLLTRDDVVVSVPAAASFAELLHGNGDEEAVYSSASTTVIKAAERRVTPLDLVQQVSLLLIPELKKLAFVSKGSLNSTALSSLSAIKLDARNVGNVREIYNDEAVLTSNLAHESNGTILEKPEGGFSSDGDLSLGGGSRLAKGFVLAVTGEADAVGLETSEGDVMADGLGRRAVGKLEDALVNSSLEVDDDPVVYDLCNEERRSGLERRRQRGTAMIPSLFRHAVRDPLPVAEPTCIDVTLLVLLENANLTYGVELTVDVLRQLLLSVGEDYWRDDVIEQMLVQAKSGDQEDGNNEPLVLDRSTFLRALTSDLDLFDERVEQHTTTHFCDANSMARPTAAKRFHEKSSDGHESTPLLERTFTAPSIDYTADTYASFSWAVLVWFLLAGFFFLYMFDGISRKMITLSCNDYEFGCKIANSILLWIEIMFKLCLFGFLYVSLSTLGNSVYLQSGFLGEQSKTTKILGVAAVLVSVTVIFCSTMVAYIVEVDAEIFNTAKSSSDQGNVEQEEIDPVLLYVTLTLGWILMGIQVIQAVRIVLPQDKTLPRTFDFVTSSADSMERNTKEAASYKVRRMMENAAACHKLTSQPYEKLDTSVRNDAMNSRRLVSLDIDGRISHALFQFQRLALKSEQVGGVWWTLKSFWNDNTLAKKEGVWIFPRLLWCHLGQWVVVFAFCAGLVRIPKDSADDLVMSGISLQQVRASLLAGGVTALVVSLATVVHYIPSAITSVLSFRSGAYGSLRDDRGFHVYRFAQDSSTTLFGSAIWGLFASGVIIWIVVFGVFYGFYWEGTRELFLNITALVIGVTVTVFIKVLVMQLFRFSWFAGFYRRRPAHANIFMVTIECWNIGLSSGYILARTLKLLLLSIIYIARIDTPFLSHGVGWILGRIPLDSYPISFKRDLLIHDAHRHPYMERWAFIYLLKLRHGKKFGTPAGAAWRIIFALTLMPWLRRHRVYPKVETEWSNRYSLASHQSHFENLYARIQQLESEVTRLQHQLAYFQDQEISV